MTTYSVIIKDAKTGAEKIVDEIRAKNQVEAKKAAFPKWFGRIDMTAEHLMVVRKEQR